MMCVQVLLAERRVLGQPEVTILPRLFKEAL